MIPYLLAFLVVSALAFIADKIYEKHKKLSIFIAVISVVALAVFAGVRDYSVGADVTVYGMQRFAREVSSTTFFGKLDTYSHIEYGYSFVNFLVSRISSNYHLFLFMHQLILSSIVYYLAFREKKKHDTKIYLTVLTYLFLWFNTSLNILRQSIAIFIQLCAFELIEKKEYNKYILVSIFAGLFHTSAFAFVIVPLLDKFFGKKHNTAKTTFSVLLILLLFFSLEPLFSLAKTIFPGFERYDKYIGSGETNLTARYLIYKLIMCGTLLVFDNLKEKTSHEKEVAKTNLLSQFAILDVVFYCLSGFIKYGYRTSYFFLIHNILYIPRIEKNIQSERNKRIFKAILVILLIGYWVNRFILSHYDGTLPYIIDASLF